MTKKCSVCRKTKSKNQFNKRTSSKDGLASQCRVCAKEKLRKSREKNKQELNDKSLKWYENNRELVRRRRRHASYGVTQQMFEKLLEIQNDGCAICGVEHDPSLYKNWKVLAVDHDHSCCSQTPTCGKCNRGLLCRGCNQALGLFKDSIHLLNKAIDYIKSPPSAQLYD